MTCPQIAGGLPPNALTLPSSNWMPLARIQPGGLQSFAGAKLPI